MTTFTPTIPRPLLQAWALLRHELVYISWAIMEVSLIMPIALAFMWWADWSPSLMMASLFVLMFVPFALARLLKSLQITAEVQRNIMFGAALLVIVLAVRIVVYDLPLFSMAWIGEFLGNVAQANNRLWQRDFHVAVLTAVVWWRGLSLVGREPDVPRLGMRLRRGGLILAPIAAVLGFYRLEWQVTSYLLLFFVAAITAVFLTRAEQFERESSSVMVAFSPGLLLRLLAAATGLVTIAGLLAQAFGSSSATVTGWFAMPLAAARFAFAVIGVTMAKLLAPVAALFEIVVNGLITFLRQAWNLLLVEYTPPEQSDFAPATNQDLIESLTRPARELNFNPQIFLAVLLVIVGVIVVLLLWAAYRGSAVANPSNRFDRLVGGLATRVIGGRNGRKKPPAAQPDWLRNWRIALSIRRIYQRMVYEAETRGYPRDEAATPYEFLPTLAQIWPDHTADTRLITSAYVRIRYGEVPESGDELNQIEAAWDRLEKAGLTRPEV